VRLLYLTVGDESSPGTRYRVYAHVPYLRSRGHEVTVLPPVLSGSRLRKNKLWRALDIVRAVGHVGSADLVILYRTTLPAPTNRLVRRRARHLVLEYDDAIWLPAPAEAQSDATVARYGANFLATLAVADLVIAGNATLAARAGSVPLEVIPTAVDLRRFRPTTVAGSRAAFVIGWVGTAENQAEWRRLAPVFKAVLAARPDIRLRVISDLPPTDPEVPVEFERWSLAREAGALDDVDVGVMPLEDTPWNRGKCSAKALQYMAMARPAVVSPVGMNREVVTDGSTGFLAAKPDEWVARLVELAGDRALAARLGQAARDRVRESYSLEVLSPRLEAALLRATRL
jgi:glycosyltransferase involved in cell wall biosynthesis